MNRARKVSNSIWKCHICTHALRFKPRAKFLDLSVREFVNTDSVVIMSESGENVVTQQHRNESSSPGATQSPEPCLSNRIGNSEAGLHSRPIDIPSSVEDNKRINSSIPVHIEPQEGQSSPRPAIHPETHDKCDTVHIQETSDTTISHSTNTDTSKDRISQSPPDRSDGRDFAQSIASTASDAPRIPQPTADGGGDGDETDESGGNTGVHSWRVGGSVVGPTGRSAVHHSSGGRRGESGGRHHSSRSGVGISPASMLTQNAPGWNTVVEDGRPTEVVRAHNRSAATPSCGRPPPPRSPSLPPAGVVDFCHSPVPVAGTCASRISL
jgi:hypothetical protein